MTPRTQEELTCTINGERFTISRKGVEKKMAGVSPEPLHDHGVKIHDRIYPVKQVIGDVTGLDRLAFQSAQSRNVLERLGFELWRAAK